MDTYEQKYKEALEKARQLCAYPTSKPFISDLQDLFPELKESEDERIRKEIMDFIDTNTIDSDERRNRWLAWLEKQKNLTDEEYEQGKKDVLWCINQAKKNAKDENEMGTCWFAEKWLEKQGKNKDLPNVTDRETLDEYAYQVAYDLSNDWMKDTATWDDVERACKLGAEWNEKHRKPAWGEEDMSKVQRICKYLDEAKKYYADINEVRECIDWLKSLKDRVQPIHEYSETEKQEIFIRSQRPHFWRPSDEQIYWLKWAVNRMPDTEKANEAEAVLEDLLEQLKELKGE